MASAHVFNDSNQKQLAGKHGRSVFAAWELSFEIIQKENPAAADLLLLCGFLDNRDIPEELLQKGLKLPEHGKQPHPNPCKVIGQWFIGDRLPYPTTLNHNIKIGHFAMSLTSFISRPGFGRINRVSIFLFTYKAKR